jgi:hypothetical protein
MTLQVGFVIPQTGILVASDQCHSEYRGGIRSTFEATKFHYGKHHLFAFSGAELGELLAIDLAAAFEHNPSTDLGTAIQSSLSTQYDAKTNEPEATGGVLAIAGGKLYRIDLMPNLPPYFQFPEVTSRVRAGDRYGSSVYFLERYHRNDLNEQQLKRLAAFFICSGAKGNSSVRGLEIAIWYPASGVEILGRPEIEELQRWAETVDLEVGNLILDSSIILR